MCVSLTLSFTNSARILKAEATKLPPLLRKTFNKSVFCWCDFLPEMHGYFICPKGHLTDRLLVNMIMATVLHCIMGRNSHGELASARGSGKKTLPSVAINKLLLVHAKSRIAGYTMYVCVVKPHNKQNVILSPASSVNSYRTSSQDLYNKPTDIKTDRKFQGKYFDPSKYTL